MTNSNNLCGLSSKWKKKKNIKTELGPKKLKKNKITQIKKKYKKKHKINKK